jgi:hypothetical protein
MQIGLRLVLLCASALLLACGDSTGPAPAERPPAALVKLTGDEQPAPVSSPLPDSLVVRVTDATGTPLGGIRVAWEVSTGGGALGPPTSTTNPAGEARAGWTLGTRAGENAATAAVAGVSPVRFTARGLAGPPAQVAKSAGDEQEATIRTSLDDSLAVRVTDAYENPVPEVRVVWAVGAGGGSTSPAESRTDAAGVAKTAWTLGAAAGENAVSASVHGLPAAPFRATARAGAAVRLLKVGGETAEGVVGRALSEPLVVRIRDAHDNPVPGISVQWTVVSGEGTIDPVAATTNSSGEAAASWTLGRTAGENRVRAGAEGLSAESFLTRGVPDAAASLQKSSGDQQLGTTGAVLGEPLAVRVLDRYGNGVPAAAVQWSVARGGGRMSPAALVTDTAGLARASWQMGDSIGLQQVSVSVAAVQAQFTATAEPADPPLAETLIRLEDGGVVGTPHFPLGNTAEGGQGQPIGGTDCIRTIAYHIHAHISLFVEGQPIAVAAGVGIVNPMVRDGYVSGGSCFYWLHTHDQSGIVHVEPPTQDSLTLGQFFDVWGQTLTSDNVAGFQGPVTVYVNGERYRGDVRAIPFSRRKEIVLYVGHRLAPLPRYTWPKHY